MAAGAHRRDAQQVLGQEGRQAADDLHQPRAEPQLLLSLRAGGAGGGVEAAGSSGAGATAPCNCRVQSLPPEAGERQPPGRPPRAALWRCRRRRPGRACRLRSTFAVEREGSGHLPTSLPPRRRLGCRSGAGSRSPRGWPSPWIRPGKHTSPACVLRRELRRVSTTCTFIIIVY